MTTALIIFIIVHLLCSFITLNFMIRESMKGAWKFEVTDLLAITPFVNIMSAGIAIYRYIIHNI